MNQYRITPGKEVDLKTYNPDDTGTYRSHDRDKIKAKTKTAKLIEKLDLLQERLYSNATRSLLIVLQGMDTSGKDSTVNHVMSGVNPLGCHAVSFKAPTGRELAHDFLWRIHQEVPAKGYIGIFNRSHYEDVLITRVHRQISDKQAEQRLAAIRDFERLLHDNGTAIVKFFLHISKEEQRARLEARVRDPEKRWKFTLNDLAERKFWLRYQKMYEEAIAATSTEHAPWYVVPANRKWFRNLVVAEVVVDALKAMDLKTPPASPDINFKTLKIV